MKLTLLKTKYQESLTSQIFSLMCAAYFLSELDSTYLNDGIVTKLKKSFTFSFFFKKPFLIFVTMMIVY